MRTDFDICTNGQGREREKIEMEIERRVWMCVCERESNISPLFSAQ